MKLLTVILTTLLLATAPARADWALFADDHPQRVGVNAYAFAIRTRVAPVGLRYASASYLLAGTTDAIAIGYGKHPDAPSIAYADTCVAIGTTLYDTHGDVAGATLSDFADGVFSGVVWSDAPLVAVRFEMEAAAFVPLHGKRGE